LQELIACFCAVIIHQTRDYGQLLNVFKACEHRLKNEIKQLNDSTAVPNIKSLPVLMYLVSTLVAYGQLDQLPAGQKRKCCEERDFDDIADSEVSLLIWLSSFIINNRRSRSSQDHFSGKLTFAGITLNADRFVRRNVGFDARTRLQYPFACL
jgi:hypothetical protein